MALTPVEIRHITLGRAPFGYSRGAVDKLLEDVIGSFEDVWRERADLADKVEHLEQELVRHRELETLLRRTLMSAERAAQELKEQAAREAGLVVDEAHAQARQITRDAATTLEHLRRETHRVRALLQSALAVLPEASESGADAQREVRAA
jgi:cell division initiation protein